jgi:site-specific DNA recombinase
MQMKKSPRVAIYARVSTSEQNIDGQIIELKNYCNARGWTISHEIVDHGYSGKSIQRPEFQRLLKLARCREIDCIVITRLDRAFRHLKSLVLTLEEWAALGITCR